MIIPATGVELAADVRVPDGAVGVVLFAHGSGSSRRSPRNRYVAEVLNRHGLATVLVDLLTPTEDDLDAVTAELRFDIGLLAGRLGGLVERLPVTGALAGLPIGLFGASTGAAAALVAAAAHPAGIPAVVSRGGRPDLAGPALARVRAATLLLVGGLDEEVLALNEQARRQLAGPAELRVVPGASHLFEEPGTLDEVARQTATWFTEHLPAGASGRFGGRGDG
ncbi:dienelactone hydrolase family protein [Micromonospora zhanjiangensis]|uniref:Dienelactone hydrolase family protein n=1 Tax=Micromonospora zhanjiangensis TaxID=1522057 RepID=A0ABV8KNY4_9ACTN